jgi:hypothetical protein
VVGIRCSACSLLATTLRLHAALCASLILTSLLSCTASRLQRCKQELLQHRGVTYGSNAAAADNGKRQRLQTSSKAESPLERDDFLDYVFSFVGGGDHLYIGGVSRRWRGRYIQHCVQSSTAEVDGKLVTRHRCVVTTESRPQLALSGSMRVEGWTFNKVPQAALICVHSLEPEKVMTLFRVHGVPWSTTLCDGAAHCNKLALLQWLQSHSCLWAPHRVLRFASMHGTVAMLE